MFADLTIRFILVFSKILRAVLEFDYVRCAGLPFRDNIFISFKMLSGKHPDKNLKGYWSVLKFEILALSNKFVLSAC